MLANIYATTRSKSRHKTSKEDKKGKKPNVESEAQVLAQDGLPKEQDPAYDRYDPPYFIPDISSEVKQ